MGVWHSFRAVPTRTYNNRRTGNYPKLTDSSTLVQRRSTLLTRCICVLLLQAPHRQSFTTTILRSDYRIHTFHHFIWHHDLPLDHVTMVRK